MAQQGIFSWAGSPSGYYWRSKNVWLAGREIGSFDNLKANIREVAPAAGGGVPVGQGFFHQATRASPQAPTEATVRSSFALDFVPQMDEDTNRRVEAAFSGSSMGIPKVWLPWMVRASWKITSARTKYTMPFTISGSGATWPALFREPIVEIFDHPGLEYNSALTRVADPATVATDFSIAGDGVSDADYITVGDLSAMDGKILMIWCWAKIEVLCDGLQQGFVGPGEWGQTLALTFAPLPRDYEAD